MPKTVIPYGPSSGLALMLCLAAVVSCRHAVSPEERLPPVTLQDLAGTWTYRDTLGSWGMVCGTVGSISLTPSDSGFTGVMKQGSGRCTATGSHGNYRHFRNTPADTLISGGRVSGRNVGFRAGRCDMQGAVSGNPPHRMRGTATCNLGVSSVGGYIIYQGPWQATR
jgi:hypothetical protein